MLKIENIDVGYGDVQVLREVSMDIQEGELLAVIGANGAGKTTLLKTISGLLKPYQGKITFRGENISGMDPDRIVAKGIIHIPEGRMLFPDMTVRENLDMGAFLAKNNKEVAENLDSVYTLFPRLKERETQLAGTLSGGEQQMLAIGRGLMGGPKLIMLDEPSLGLAPILVQGIFKMIQHINDTLGVTVLLVEQNVRQSCEVSDRAFVLENGRIVMQGSGKELLSDDHVRQAYLGL
jgi:branched-chain amino acid transport system ATP-binding protein